VITILETAALNTVQDLGRFGLRNMGVGSSGVMDPIALKVANMLLGNAAGDAGIEIQTFPFRLRFDVRTIFVVTGAQASLQLDGRALIPWVVAEALPGQVLEIGQPCKGARAYLAVAGGISVPSVLGSRSTQLRGGFGGFEGRFLASGDTLPIAGLSGPSGFGAVPPGRYFAEAGEVANKAITVRAIPSTDHDRFTPQSIERFWNVPWRITPQSDRIGYRLRGEALSLIEARELRSYGIVPGIVQVPPAGEPIVQMADANTAGGYPRIACVIDADLWRLAQAPIGATLHFRRCTHAEGVSAQEAISTYLESLRSTVGHVRSSTLRQSGNGKKSA
jgi:biotin-dependent carboxylase-like uncharacterized protein